VVTFYLFIWLTKKNCQVFSTGYALADPEPATEGCASQDAPERFKIIFVEISLVIISMRFSSRKHGNCARYYIRKYVEKSKMNYKSIKYRRKDLNPSGLFSINSAWWSVLFVTDGEVRDASLVNAHVASRF
jgi:hypothetical protein